MAIVPCIITKSQPKSTRLLLNQVTHTFSTLMTTASGFVFNCTTISPSYDKNITFQPAGRAAVPARCFLKQRRRWEAASVAWQRVQAADRARSCSAREQWESGRYGWRPPQDLPTNNSKHQCFARDVEGQTWVCACVITPTDDRRSLGL